MYLGFLRLPGHKVGHLALVFSQVIRRRHLELVLVDGVLAVLDEVLVDLRAVLVPEDFGKRVAASGFAGQCLSVPGSHRLAFSVAGDFWGAGWV